MERRLRGLILLIAVQLVGLAAAVRAADKDTTDAAPRSKTSAFAYQGGHIPRAIPPAQRLPTYNYEYKDRYRWSPQHSQRHEDPFDEDKDPDEEDE